MCCVRLVMPGTNVMVPCKHHLGYFSGQTPDRCSCWSMGGRAGVSELRWKVNGQWSYHDRDLKHLLIFSWISPRFGTTVQSNPSFSNSAAFVTFFHCKVLCVGMACVACFCSHGKTRWAIGLSGKMESGDLARKSSRKSSRKTCRTQNSRFKNWWQFQEISNRTHWTDP